MEERGPRPEEEWRDMVDAYFGDIGETDNALVIIDCESNGDPFALNPRSDASGLFQFLPSTWDKWNPRTEGWEDETPFHPEANTATARRLFDAYVAEGKWGWTPWSCKHQL
jgi:muramidase (phage lysozyme)